MSGKSRDGLVSQGGLNEQFTVKGVHGHTFPIIMVNVRFRSTSMQQQSSSQTLSMRFNLAGKGTGFFLPDAQIAPAWAMTESERKRPERYDPDATGWRWRHSRYCVPDRLRGHCLG
ncbi:hypothetical protein [Escherichia coli]|uniref:hypothetical protein n=1 Tax=Escherichia coli TaxID=562 RepID=UPI0039A779C2